MDDTNMQTNQAPKQTGTVKWFNHTKGFGFIAPDEGTDNGKDIFVHASSIISNDMRPSLNDDDRVEFRVEEGPKGPSAVEVKLISDEDEAAPVEEM